MESSLFLMQALKSKKKCDINIIVLWIWQQKLSTLCLNCRFYEKIEIEGNIVDFTTKTVDFTAKIVYYFTTQLLILQRTCQFTAKIVEFYVRNGRFYNKNVDFIMKIVISSSVHLRVYENTKTVVTFYVHAGFTQNLILSLVWSSVQNPGPK